MLLATAATLFQTRQRRKDALGLLSEDRPPLFWLMKKRMEEETWQTLGQSLTTLQSLKTLLLVRQRARTEMRVWAASGRQGPCPSTAALADFNLPAFSLIVQFTACDSSYLDAFLEEANASCPDLELFWQSQIEPRPDMAAYHEDVLYGGV